MIRYKQAQEGDDALIAEIFTREPGIEQDLLEFAASHY